MIHCYEFYASSVISKPRYFELFPISLQTSVFNCSNHDLSVLLVYFLTCVTLARIQLLKTMYGRSPWAPVYG